MNRKKKIYETLKKKDKRANAKLHKSNKPRYVSKAQRAAMQDQPQGDELDTPQAPNEAN